MYKIQRMTKKRRLALTNWKEKRHGTFWMLTSRTPNGDAYCIHIERDRNKLKRIASRNRWNVA